jgi:hypothetical protein
MKKNVILFISELNITHIIAVFRKNRLRDHGIVVQLPAGARDSKFSTSFL